MNNSKPSNPSESSGFTIVEFMIATTVFSVILLAVTAAILQIGKTYQRSLYASNTQAATSNLIDTVAQSVKFSSGQIIDGTNGDTKSLCVGNRQILYVTGKQLGGSNSGTKTENAVITRLKEGQNCSSPEDIITTAPTSGSPSELLGRGMRLSKFAVTSDPSTSMITIAARVVYGDDDLLCSETASPGSCANSAQLSSSQLKTATDLSCKAGSGSQFCTVSELSTTVYQRL